MTKKGKGDQKRERRKGENRKDKKKGPAEIRTPAHLHAQGNNRRKWVEEELIEGKENREEKRSG